MKNSTRSQSLQNQKGQLVVEAVLLTALLVGISILIQNKLKETRFLEKLIADPWVRLSGMIECGSWKPCKSGTGIHPNLKDRYLSIDPKAPL